MEDEPNVCAPVPSPHPSSGLEASCALLELTPEKPAGRSRKSKRLTQLKQHDFQNLNGDTDHKLPDGCRELAVPGVNTSAPLYHQLQQYRQTNDRGKNSTGKKRGGGRHSVVSEDPFPSTPLSTTDTTTCQTLTGAPTMTVAAEAPEDESQSPIDCGSRYSELVAVDISDESFQQLTTRPRKTRPSGGGRRGRRGPPEAAPNIMDFFSPDFEVEDLDIDPTLPATQPLEPSVPSCGDALTLYHFVNSY